MKAIIVLAALWMVLFCPNSAVSGDSSRPDKPIASHKVKGRLVLFEEGDYLHVTVKSRDGKEISFLLGSEGCFLAKHYDNTLEIWYREVERYFPEGGGYFPVNLAQSISVDKGKAKWNASEKPPKDELSCIRILKERLGKHNAK
jgi:hypothetical protein